MEHRINMVGRPDLPVGRLHAPIHPPIFSTFHSGVLLFPIQFIYTVGADYGGEMAGLLQLCDEAQPSPRRLQSGDG